VLIMLNGKIEVVPDHPEISSKCRIDIDRPVLGLRNRQALHALQEAMTNRHYESRNGLIDKLSKFFLGN
jgi:hypothetical protein